jgi:hypothetical protein
VVLICKVQTKCAMEEQVKEMTLGFVGVWSGRLLQAQGRSTCPNRLIIDG